MKIKNLTLSNDEVNTAVGNYLKTQGIHCPVHSVSKKYSWEEEYEVTFDFEVEKPEAQPPIHEPDTTKVAPETLPLASGVAP